MPADDQTPADEEWGCAGVGVSGQWQVDLDRQPASGAWQVVIQGAAVYLLVDVTSSGVVRDAGAFMSGGVPDAECALGRCAGGEVFLIRDAEIIRRHFIRIRGAHTMAEFTLASEDARDLGRALVDAARDAESAG